MHLRSPLGYAATAATIVILASCSGNAPALRSLQRSSSRESMATRANAAPTPLFSAMETSNDRSKAPHTFVSPAISNPGRKGFFSAWETNVVSIYDPNGTLIGTLAGFSDPEGLATDATGKLYVADEHNNRVQVYSPPYTGTPMTLNDPGENPIDVAVDASGDIAVSNVHRANSMGTPSISFYESGSTNPSKTVSSNAFSLMFYCAFDATGDLYVDGQDSNGNFLAGEIVDGIFGTSIRILSTANSISFPGGVQVTPSGLIAIEDQRGHTVYTYNPPIDGSLGSPVSSTPLDGLAANSVSFAFGPATRFLYTADSGGYGKQYPYTAGGASVQTVHPGGVTVGAAVTPTESF